MTHHHPIRDLPINAYCGEREWLALIGTGNGYPFFRAKSRHDAIGKAEAFRQDVIDKSEAKVIARMEAAAARKAKGAHDAAEVAA